MVLRDPQDVRADRMLPILVHRRGNGLRSARGLAERLERLSLPPGADPPDEV